MSKEYQPGVYRVRPRMGDARSPVVYCDGDRFWLPGWECPLEPAEDDGSFENNEDCIGELVWPEEESRGMIIGFTGTRNGMTVKQNEQVHAKLLKAKLLKAEFPSWGIHGGCIGADAEFHEECVAAGFTIEVYPGFSKRDPKDLTHRALLDGAFTQHPPAGHFERNRMIVHRCDVLYACPPTNERLSRGGTWYTIDHAEKVGKPVVIFWPDGRVSLSGGQWDLGGGE